MGLMKNCEVDMIKFTIPVEPKPQKRCEVGGKRHFKNSLQQKRETELIWHLKSIKQKLGMTAPLDGALSIDIKCYFEIPKSYTKKKKKAIENGELLYIKFPDSDNLSKQIGDMLTKAGFWLDDRLVNDLRVRKFYDDGKGPRWEIEINKL